MGNVYDNILHKEIRIQNWVCSMIQFTVKYECRDIGACLCALNCMPSEDSPDLHIERSWFKQLSPCPMKKQNPV